MKREKKRNKPSYKGPFQNNPELQIHNVRKTMKSENKGPTIDGFSEIDSTINLNSQNKIVKKTQTKRTKRPTKEKKIKWLSIENILITIFTLFTAGIGIIVYNHSNKFVSIEKDIEYIRLDASDKKAQIDKIIDKTTEMDKKVDLLNQKIDLK
jgi:hypothetical protein